MQAVGQVRDYGDACLAEGDALKALKAFATLLRHWPSEVEARLRLADCLAALEAYQNAASVYTATMRYASYAGYPLHALVAIHRLNHLSSGELATLWQRFAELYSKDSPNLGRGSRVSLMDDDELLPATFSPELPPMADKLIAAATDLGSSLAGLDHCYPDKLAPIPLLSELSSTALTAMLQHLSLLRLERSAYVFRQGAQGLSFFMLARGRVVVVERGEQGEERNLAELASGSLFGEAALVLGSPRTASVCCLRSCDLLEFDRNALKAVGDELPTVAQTFDNFARRRMLHNIVESAPLFTKLDAVERATLVRHFHGYDVCSGVNVIEQGKASPGVYVLWSGSAEVKVERDGSSTTVHTLRPGEICGELSALSQAPASATVRSTERSHWLFLPRESFARACLTLPRLREYVEELSAQRRFDLYLLGQPDSLTPTVPFAAIEPGDGRASDEHTPIGIDHGGSARWIEEGP